MRSSRTPAAADPTCVTTARFWATTKPTRHGRTSGTGRCATFTNGSSSIDYRRPDASPFGDGIRVTYHDSCHLAHGQKVVGQPRAIVRSLAGVSFVELAESAWCCGSAGIYNITQPEQSEKLLERKVRHVLATGASIVTTANPGCHLQILRGLRNAGAEVEVQAPVSLLARAYRAERAYSR